MASIRDTPDTFIALLPRLETFRRWTSSFPPVRLAQAGFVYTEEGHIVICPFSQVEGSNWCEGDDPLADHIGLSPNYPFFEVIFLYAKIKNGFIRDHLKVTLQSRLKTFTEWPIALEQNPQTLAAVKCRTSNQVSSAVSPLPFID